MSKPLRCVLDTNVLISAGISPHGTPRRVLQWVIEHGVLLASKETLNEFASRFIMRDKFDRYASKEARKQFVAITSAAAEVVPITTRVRISRDPDDDMFIALAVDAQADFIITGNTKHFPAKHQRIAVVTPAQFSADYIPG